MSQDESRKETLMKMKRAQSGKEFGDAMLNHFKLFMKTKAPDYSEALEILNTPLYGLKTSQP